MKGVTSLIDWNNESLKQSILAWLQEDIGTGDVTTMATVRADHDSNALIHVKEAGRIAGLPAAELVFRLVDPALRFSAKQTDGDEVESGTVIAEVEGSSRSILLGERLALNLLQRLSGIATKTAALAKAVESYDVRLADTRKTTPGHRALEKYAVRIGGGYNHRFGLYDAVLIKDNHIKASGGVQKAVERAKEYTPHTMKIEVEVETAEQVDEAVDASADIIMLDNMKPDQMKAMTQRIKQALPHTVVEASGSVSIETIEEIARTGVDVISMGSLTYSFKALDISLDLLSQKENR